ncbi:CLUMA_CG016885, isoform A [Clunio marinus]|uniref:CLUMA_CG016885, isoform A n=1 Tax=Clunio marinus TaxID=568069 RepID=A0A1J1IS79_9DIPT|nr:CLUMA_CG016885, isoform A [Clunio marinus]
MLRVSRRNITSTEGLRMKIELGKKICGHLNLYRRLSQQLHNQIAKKIEKHSTCVQCSGDEKMKLLKFSSHNSEKGNSLAEC